MMTNLVTYLCILVFAFAVVMTLVGILRWVADAQKRERRIAILSICSVVLLVILFLSGNWNVVSGVWVNIPQINDNATISLINISKITIKVLLIVLIIAFSLILVFIAALLVVYSGRAFFNTISSFKGNNKVQLNQKLKEDAEKITILLKNPVFIVGVAGGVLSIFFILPLLMGDEVSSLAECWKTGVENIVSFCSNSNSDNNSDSKGFARNLSSYLLIFISIIGVGYGVGNILFEIIRERVGRKNDFLKEYSSSIGLLAVGISVLLLISFPPEVDKNTSWIKKLIAYSEPFVTVIFVIAFGVIILEIVRLLMDMREKMIRREARYIFVLLVGLCTVIIMRTFIVVYNAIGSAVGGKSKHLERAEERIQKVYDSIIEKIAIDMEEEIEEESRVDSKVPYNIFKGTTTKK